MKRPGSVNITTPPCVSGVGARTVLPNSRESLDISLRIRYCTALAKDKLSDYSYRRGELAGFNFLDFLVDTSEVDIAENMSMQWTTNRVGHEMRESGTKSCPCVRIQYATRRAECAMTGDGNEPRTYRDDRSNPRCNPDTDEGHGDQ